MNEVIQHRSVSTEHDMLLNFVATLLYSSALCSILQLLWVASNALCSPVFRQRPPCTWQMSAMRFASTCTGMSYPKLNLNW